MTRSSWSLLLQEVTCRFTHRIFGIFLSGHRSRWSRRALGPCRTGTGMVRTDSPADYRTGTRETWTVFDAERSEAFDDTARTGTGMM